MMPLSMSGDGGHSRRAQRVGREDGIRESEQSWKALLLNLQRRGLSAGPELAIGDGALGFWKAVAHVYGTTQWQRCWEHKTANVLNTLPKSLQAKAQAGLHEIWMAPTPAEATQAFDGFLQTYEEKYPKSCQLFAEGS